jgi:TatD family-associated radical SAM protein
MNKIQTVVYEYGNALYLNITNRCPCDCIFCLRRHGDGVTTGQSLWLAHEPSHDEIEAALRPVDYSRYNEAVFCGYGEPCERLEALCFTAGLIRGKTGLPIRLNTNGLSDLINNKKTAPILAGYIERISISLNAPDAETYNNLCRPVFGAGAFNAVVQFALDCKNQIPDTTVTIVAAALTEEQIQGCRALCKTLGLRLRLR